MHLLNRGQQCRTNSANLPHARRFKVNSRVPSLSRFKSGARNHLDLQLGQLLSTTL